ncbi:MAG TPA: caspase family protein [Trichocoleus sp.]
MGLGRRAFLQRLSLTLGALGLGEAAVSRWTGQYQQALAQPTHRKLALLIGIDQYSPAAIDPALAPETVALRGAVTDVELQRELLIYRFGFQPADIVTLTNGAATRERILAAVEGHLNQQAQAGDVVLLHFSGYGSQVRIDQAEELRRSLVPVDGFLPTEEVPELNDVLQDDLRGRLRSLKTQQITTLLDAGYRDLGQVRWGTLRVRSRPAIPTGVLPESVLATLPAAEQGLSWPGLLLRAASPDRLVLEGSWPGFSVGAFTYALTQTLWETLPSTSLQVVFNRAATQVQRWTGPDQQPELTGKQRAENGLQPYHLTPLRPQADGLITGASEASRTVSLWLGGLPADVLRYLQPASRLVVDTGSSASTATDTPDPAPAPTELVVQSRSGPTAAALVSGEQAAVPEVGQSVYEQVRVLPRAIDLVVALDTNLGRVERVDATSALSGISFVSSALASEQPADCLFGHLPKPAVATLTAALPETNGAPVLATSAQTDPEPALDRSYGLFAPNRTLVPGTLIARGEAVKTAVNRLTPQLRSQLAMKLLRLTSNRYNSQLAVRVALETTYPEEQLLAQGETLRSPSPLPKARLPKRVAVDAPPLQLNADSRLRYRISNYSGQDLYRVLVSFDSRGQFLAQVPSVPESHPVEERQSALVDSSIVPSSTPQMLPLLGDWGVPQSVSWVETYVIFSRSPFPKTWELLAQEDSSATPQPGLQRLDQPLKVARALLADLHDGSVAYDPTLAATDQYSLHSACWASLSFRCPVR